MGVPPPGPRSSVSPESIAQVRSALEGNRSLLWQMKKRLVEGLQNCITDDTNMQCCKGHFKMGGRHVTKCLYREMFSHIDR